MKAITIALCLGLAACQTTAGEPRVITKEVVVEKAVPCSQPLPDEPEWPDTDAAIAAAPNVFERGKLFVAGRLLHFAYEAELRAWGKACN